MALGYEGRILNCQTYIHKLSLAACISLLVVLHGVLDPEAHVNGFKKNKNKIKIATTSVTEASLAIGKHRRSLVPVGIQQE